MNKILIAIVASFALVTAPAQADDNPAVVDALSGYMDFAEYGSSLIWPEQIPADDWKKVFIVDARDAAQFAKEHIPGAVNIEWRQAVARRDRDRNRSSDRRSSLSCRGGKRTPGRAMDRRDLDRLGGRRAGGRTLAAPPVALSS